MGRVFLSIFLIIVTFVSGCLNSSDMGNNTNMDTSLNDLPETTVDINSTQNTPGVLHEIEMSSSGFTPKTLTINQGDKVMFVNTGSQTHWPASDIHPTHRSYPGTDINKCGSGKQNSMFDSCGGVGPGKSYSFTFTEKGTWYYHDHFAPRLTGTIIVE